jgi:energy-coupling factor transport system permease protein
LLKQLHPLSKLTMCLVWLMASIILFDARFQVLAIVVVWVTLIGLNGTSPVLLAGLTIPFALFGFGFMTTSLLFREDSSFALQMAGEALFRSDGFAAGTTLFLRSIACGTISAFFALTTDPSSFVRASMACLKVPPRIGYAIFAAMQLVPDIVAETQQMRFARAMKSGRHLRRFPGPVETFSLVIPLLAFAIRRAGRTAISLESRGLSNSPRTIMNVPRFALADIAFCFLGSGALAFCVLALSMLPPTT